MAEFAALREQLAERGAKLSERDAKLEALQAQNNKFRKMIFGRRSEKLPPISSEVRKAVEEQDFPLDVPAGASSDEIDKARTTQRRKRGRKKSNTARAKRRKALEKLPVVHERVDVTPDKLPEGMTLSDFRPLGDGEVVRRIEHVREHLVVVEYHLQKLVERGGECIVQASAPPNVVDGGAWGPSVYAHVVVSKCVDSMPLYRIERALGRGGHAVARSVLCGLFHRDECHGASGACVRAGGRAGPAGRFRQPARPGLLPPGPERRADHAGQARQRHPLARQAGHRGWPRHRLRPRIRRLLGRRLTEREPP